MHKIFLVVLVLLNLSCHSKSAHSEPKAHSPKQFANTHSDEAYRAHIIKLKKRLKGLKGNFECVVEKPFVVIGDASRAKVERYARGFIRRTVKSLQAEYFPKYPNRILDIYLFFGKRSYLINAKKLTGSYPDTPYGFYMSSINALIMNISTGAGTLSHELVHPFMEANFENCPPWLNEGLGSLYEHVGWPKGKIHGYLNWRLPGLQDAIRAKNLASFKYLMSLNEDDFYGKDPGTHYGQSRYLLYYLQEKGLLRQYYHQFHQAYPKVDKTGLITLKRILKIDDMLTFEKTWMRYILKQRYR